MRSHTDHGGSNLRSEFTTLADKACLSISTVLSGDILERGMPRVDLDARRDPNRSAPWLIGIIFRVDGEKYGPGPLVKISRHVKRVPGGTISPLRTAAMYAHTRVASACDLVSLGRYHSEGREMTLYGWRAVSPSMPGGWLLSRSPLKAEKVEGG